MVCSVSMKPFIYLFTYRVHPQPAVTSPFPAFSQTHHKLPLHLHLHLNHQEVALLYLSTFVHTKSILSN